jgi:hypothetical protein
MMITSQLEHPDLSLPVRRIGLLAVFTTFPESTIFASLPCQIPLLIDVDIFRVFVDAINGAPPDVTDANMADLSSLAMEFGFVRLLGQIEAHDPRFPVPRSATWHCENVPQRIANLEDAIPPGRNEVMMNLTGRRQELAGHWGPEVH